MTVVGPIQLTQKLREVRRFQSLLLWMTVVGDDVVHLISFPTAPVTILVVVDDGRRLLPVGAEGTASAFVSILVVVDDGRRHPKTGRFLAGQSGFQSLLLWMTVVGRKKPGQKLKIDLEVSILVVVDDGRRRFRPDRRFAETAGSFNPCC